MSHHDDDLTTIDLSTLDEVTGGAVAAASSTAQLTTALQSITSNASTAMARVRAFSSRWYPHPRWRSGDQLGHV